MFYLWEALPSPECGDRVSQCNLHGYFAAESASLARSPTDVQPKIATGWLGIRSPDRIRPERPGSGKYRLSWQGCLGRDESADQWFSEPAICIQGGRYGTRRAFAAERAAVWLAASSRSSASPAPSRAERVSPASFPSSGTHPPGPGGGAALRPRESRPLF